MARSSVFVGGQAVSMLGDGLAVLAVPLLVLQLSRSPLLAVLASLPGSAGYLTAGLPAGVLADQQHRPAGWRSVRQELAEGVRYLAATRLLLTLMCFLLVLNLCLGADKLIIFLARTTLQLPPDQVGLIVTAGGIGGLIGAAGTRLLVARTGPLPAVTVAAAASGLALILIGSATSAPVLLIGNLLNLRPVFAAAGILTLACSAAAWLAGLRKEDGTQLAAALLGR